MSFKGNKLCQLLDVKIPIISASMLGISTSALVTAVTLAGGFGILGISNSISIQKVGIQLMHLAPFTSTDSPEAAKIEFGSVRQILGTKPGSPLPIGAGFICWLLDEDEEAGKRVVKAALDEQVKAVWFTFGQDIGKWIKFVKDFDASNGKKTITIVQFGTVSMIQTAIHDWKVDIVVAQGNEAGGHGYSSAPSIKQLLPSILPLATDNGPVILGSGGVVTGAQVAELLNMGASGAVLGTRFSMTTESRLGELQKKALLSAPPNLSVRSMAFDEVKDTMGWPRGVDGRGLRTASVDDYERGDDIGVLRAKLQETIRNGDMSRAVIWTGTGYSLIKEIKPAKDVVDELHRECLRHLKN